MSRWQVYISQAQILWIKKLSIWCLCWLKSLRTECWIYGEVAKDGFGLILDKFEPLNQVVRGNHNFLNPGRSTADREKNSPFHHALPFSKQSHALNTSVHTQVFKAWLWGENVLKISMWGKRRGFKNPSGCRWGIICLFLVVGKLRGMKLNEVKGN